MTSESCWLRRPGTLSRQSSPRPPRSCVSIGQDGGRRIILGFDVDGAFRGWYVDFELPVRPTPYGLESKDLVLDLWINPDRSWRWKDRDGFERAIDQSLVPDETRAELRNETDLVLSELADRSGPFSADYPSFVPDAGWEPPMLPVQYAWAGSEWTLPPRPRP